MFCIPYFVFFISIFPQIVSQSSRSCHDFFWKFFVIKKIWFLECNFVLLEQSYLRFLCILYKTVAALYRYEQIRYYKNYLKHLQFIILGLIFLKDFLLTFKVIRWKSDNPACITQVFWKLRGTFTKINQISSSIF